MICRDNAAKMMDMLHAAATTRALSKDRRSSGMTNGGREECSRLPLRTNLALLLAPWPAGAP